MSRPWRVAVMLDLKWPYRRRADVFAGMQRYGQEQGWVSIIDEYADDRVQVHPTRRVPCDGVIARALEFIATNSHLKIVPNDVAQAVNRGLRTLQRRFRMYLDRPIATEIRRVRIERAKRELTQMDRSIALIFRDVGFDSPIWMHGVFFRELGVTPTEYRRQRQAQTGV